MRKNKNIIIALVIIILIVAGIVALLYTRTDLFKSDEDLFYKYLLSTEFVNKEVSQRALTKHLGIQPGSVSEVLKKLEDNGLITRLASEDDRRTSILSLTAEGEEAAKKALSHKDQLYNEMLEVLDEKDKQELLALLEKLNDDWDHKYHHKHKHKKKKGE